MKKDNLKGTYQMNYKSIFFLLAVLLSGGVCIAQTNQSAVNVIEKKLFV